MQRPDFGKKSKSFLLISQTGCFLPLFIVFNLFFGWIFLGFLKWLLIEVLLILILMVKSIIIAKKITSISPGPDKVIDVKGEVIRDTKDRRLT